MLERVAWELAREDHDKCIWLDESIQSYSVKSLYSLLRGQSLVPCMFNQCGDS